MQISLHLSKPAVERRPNESGIALYVVIIFVMLSMLLALWAARSAIFNEMIIGNDADYRRTFEAAQAMLQDAELDIRGVRPDGSLCIADASKPEVCRPQSGTYQNIGIYFDIETKELNDILAKVEARSPTTKCYKGICQKRTGIQDFWNDATATSRMTAIDVGARYGQFTGASAENTANPILAVKNDANLGAWYWVEMMPYIDPKVSLLQGLPPGSNVERFAPAQKKLFVYRITALARGNKTNSEVVLQSTLSIQVAE